MTRETKIGLLVGLAFIIVIGILLSDHLQSAAPQAGAYATETRPNVDSSVRAPRSARPLPPQVNELPQNRPVITTPAPGQPDNRNALSPQQPDDDDVSIGPARNDRYVERPQLDLSGRNRLNMVPDVEVTRNTDRDRIRSIPPVQPERVRAEDRGGSETPRNNVLTLGNEQENNRNVRSPEDPVVQPPAAPPVAGVRAVEHVAEPGDTVSKMAARYLGSRSLANQNLIINANPVLRANPHKIVVGQKYTIPVQPAGNGGRGTNTSTRDNAVGDATPVRETPATPADDAAAFENLRAILAADHSAGPEVEYTSKPGDTIWGIAVRECNTPSNATVAKILEMNKDVLRGDPRNLRPNMKLRLPPKTVPAGARTTTPALTR